MSFYAAAAFCSFKGRRLAIVDDINIAKLIAEMMIINRPSKLSTPCLCVHCKNKTKVLTRCGPLDVTLMATGAGYPQTRLLKI